MVNQQLIQNFILSISKQLSMHLNFMNDKGVIIVSSRPERIGTFHQGAYQMLKDKTNLLVTDGIDCGQDMVGVIPPGINLLLYDGSEPFGVLGCSGDPEQVLPIGRVIKSSIEMFVKLESSSDSNLADDKFIQALLFDTPENAQHIYKLALARHIEISCPRICILLCTEELAGTLIQISLSEVYKQISSALNNDFVLHVTPWRTLILKELPEKNFLSYKHYVENYIEELQKAIDVRLKQKHSASVSTIMFYCGMPQLTLLETRKMYTTLDWLTKNIKKRKINHFRDYMFEYFVDNFDKNILSQVLEPLYEKFSATTNLDIFINTIGPFIDSGLNLEQTGKELFVHRNTVVNRIRKIQNALSIAPFSNVKDAIFLMILFRYIMTKTRT